MAHAYLQSIFWACHYFFNHPQKVTFGLPRFSDCSIRISHETKNMTENYSRYMTHNDEFGLLTRNPIGIDFGGIRENERYNRETP